MATDLSVERIRAERLKPITERLTKKIDGMNQLAAIEQLLKKALQLIDGCIERRNMPEIKAAETAKAEAERKRMDAERAKEEAAELAELQAAEKLKARETAERQAEHDKKKSSKKA